MIGRMYRGLLVGRTKEMLRQVRPKKSFYSFRNLIVIIYQRHDKVGTRVLYNYSSKPRLERMDIASFRFAVCRHSRASKIDITPCAPTTLAEVAYLLGIEAAGM
jgi:hypothetical protein